MEAQTPDRHITATATPDGPNLPPGVMLFIGGGIPSVFRRLDTPEPTPVEDWLYVPDRVLEEVIASVPPEQRLGPIAALPFSLDEGGTIHPLLIGGKVRACLADLREPDHNEDIDWPAVTNWLVHRELIHFHESPSAIMPPAALVTCDTTPERLVRSALNLLVEQVPSGLAATYDERDGLYRMRTAVGNIAMWDILEGELPHSTASRWLEAIEQGRWFLPAGFLPERPMLLGASPDFLFVHHGLQSDQMRSLVAMPVPGDISREAGERAITVARMIAGLHENRLGMTEDLLAMSSRFDATFRTQSPLDTLLKDVFDILTRRVGLSRLVFYTEGDTCRTVHKRIQEEPVVREDAIPVIAAAIRLATNAGRTFVSDIAAGGHLQEDEAKRYYLDNVKSEFCFRVSSTDSPDILIAFGSAEIGSRLRKAERLLEVAASYLHLYRGFVQLTQDGPEPSTEATDPDPRALHRLTTVAALADGHIHSMFDTLSWMLGETELSVAGVDSASPAGPLQPFGRAVEKLVQRLEQVRCLLHEAPANGPSGVPLKKLLNELPAVFEGYIHWLQDTKNIAVKVLGDRRAAPSLSLRQRDVYDALYPVIRAIMNEATQSGEMTVKAVQLDGANAIEIACPHDLTGHTNLRAIVEQWSGIRPHPQTPGGRRQFDCDHCRWICSSETDDPQRAWLIPTGRATDRNRPGRNTASKTEVR